ncbi:MAG: HAD family hydrolase [Methylococcales symbiont of Iophon sp. n. MRB-2018]|nr:MAG: HAD family hydrolase [Methylococcales symbiont of Iophon sp. n. MRB-2018]KAF3980276.1 MAG: HAD family hydrolase [Methylococcales symbiont of Iophon sp. n. MRB-2018]
MKQSIIYALDFDGVICDSVLETGISGWKAASYLWDDIKTAMPSQQIIDDFRAVRPIMGTGYEAILINKMLHDGISSASILKDFDSKKNDLIKASKLNIDALKKLYGETRDVWIKDNIDEWVEKNPLFPNMAEKLQRLTDKAVWYIVTTKQERFVKWILSANNVQIPDERIYGLDRKQSKQDTLIDLLKKHPDQQLYFVEDMLSSLLKVKSNHQLQSVKLLFAPWGYNTVSDRLYAKNLNIEWVNLDDFLEKLDTDLC